MERFTAGGQGPTSGCSAIEEEDDLWMYNYFLMAKSIAKNFGIDYSSVPLTMVCGPPVVLKICPCGPSKNTEEKFKFKLIACSNMTHSRPNGLSPLFFTINDFFNCNFDVNF